MNSMQTFAQISPGELAPILGIIGGMLVAFYALVRYMLSQAKDDRVADRTERKQLVKAINNMAASNRAIAKETAKGNLEAKQRNGHLANLTIQSKNDTLAALAKITNIENQEVQNQTVTNETVINKGE